MAIVALCLLGWRVRAASGREVRDIGGVVSRRSLTILVATLGLTSLSAAQTPDRWRAHPTVGVLDRITVRIHWYETSAELREAAKSSGQDILARGLHGFSTLRRNAATGEYVCDLHSVKMQGQFVDKDRTKTFGHEVLHCVGLGHE